MLQQLYHRQSQDLYLKNVSFPECVHSERTQTCDKFSIIASQVQAHSSHVVRICQSAERHIEQEFLDVLVRGWYTNKALKKWCGGK